MIKALPVVVSLVFMPLPLYASSSGKDLVADQKRPSKPFLMSRQKYRRLQALLPTVNDSVLQQILQNDRLMLYTDKEMPKAYQDWDGGLRGIHSVDYNVSADNREPFGNANLEFPWGTPAGTHRAKNVDSFRFLWLPRNQKGETLPVVWYRQRFPSDSLRGYAWTFPVGTILGEVLLVRAPDNKQYTFELRVRIREFGEWSVDVFRPFPRATDLAASIKEIRPNWREISLLAKLVNHLEKPITMQRYRLADDHPRLTFDQSMGIDSLPPIRDDKLVARLLSETKFKSGLGDVWRYGTDGLYTCAPTTTAEFHIVPANYDAGFIEVDRVSCMRCHGTVGAHAREFQFGREWYGRVRGSDGIFSFHPFEPSSISPNGFGRTVRMRTELREAGLLERFNPERHAGNDYQLLHAQLD